MQKQYSLVVIAFLCSLVSISQILHSESFEGAVNIGYSSTGVFSDGAHDYFDLIGEGTDPSGVPFYTGADGLRFWAAEDNQDIDNPNPSGISTLSFSNIDVSGYSTVNVSGLFAAGSLTHFDDDDYVRIYYQIDGGGFMPLGAFEGAGPGGTFNTSFHQDTNLDGLGDGIQLTAFFQQFSFPISVSGNSLDLQIDVFMTANSEAVAIDNIIVSNGCNITSPGLSKTSCNVGPSNNGSDDFITFELNPLGSTLSSSYNVSVSSGSITPTSGLYGATTTFRLQNGSAGAGNVTIDIADASGSPCELTNIVISDPGVCSGGVCGGSESFDNSNATGTYADNNYVGDDGVTWTYGHSRNESAFPITGNGIMLRRASDSYLEATLQGGVGTLSFDYRKAFTNSNDKQLELLVDGVQVATSPVFGNVAGEDTTIYNFNHTINQPTQVTIRIKNVGNSATNRQIVIDNISWTCYTTPVGPELQLVSANGNEDCGSYDINFGDVGDGASLLRTFEINNSGNSSLTVFSVTNSNPTDFIVVSPMFPFVLTPGASQTISVQFNADLPLGAKTGTLTFISDDSLDGNDETSCSVTMDANVIDNDSGGGLMITQYYEGSAYNKWIEIMNVSDSPINPSGYYLATYNQSYSGSCVQQDLNGVPSNSIALPNINLDPGEVIRLCEPTPNGTISPAYAADATGTNQSVGGDGNPTFYMFNASFSGDDVIIISTTNDSASYSNRIDIIGEFSTPCKNGEWGEQKSLVRKEICGSLAKPSFSFIITDWDVYNYDDPEIVNALPGTNEYLGQHFRGTTIYTGSGIYNGWNNGLPRDEMIAKITTNYDTSIKGDFSCCSLTIDNSSNLDIKDGNYVEITNDLTIAGSLDIRNEGQLIMTNDYGNISGSANVYKTTAAMDQYDYVYWSSPIDYSDVLPLPPPTIEFVLNQFNPNHMYYFETTNFDDADNDTFDDNQDDWTLFSSYMVNGVGYATMTSNSTAVANNTTFVGKVNNGVILVPLAESLDSDSDPIASGGDLEEDDWNLVGNPYPSAISADDFISYNSNINGTIYFWTHNSDIGSGANIGPDAYNFSTDDYAMYNLSGGITAASGGGIPSGNIASGQGFFVDAIDNMVPSNLEFNNSMRSSSLSNDDFFRNSQNNSSYSEQEKDRFWLNLTNPDGIFSQILIGFFDDATNNRDRLYDGVRLKGTNYVDFYSMDDSTLEYGIQGRPQFRIDDVIDIGYNSHVVSNLSIELENREGELINQPIYLVDNYEDVIHDLSISPYIFNTSTGNFSDRFQIVFAFDTLSIGNVEIETSDLQIIELANGSTKFKLIGPHLMKSIEIIDLLGRTLYTFNAENSNEKIYSLTHLSQSTYLVKVQLTNGSVIVKKGVKQK